MAGGIEGGGQADGLGKLRGSVRRPRRAAPRSTSRRPARSAAEWRAPGSPVAGLFLKRHAVHQVGRALLRRQAGLRYAGFCASCAPAIHEPGQSCQSCRQDPKSNFLHRIPHSRDHRSVVDSKNRRFKRVHVFCCRKISIRPPAANPNIPGSGCQAGRKAGRFSMKNRFIAILCPRRPRAGQSLSLVWKYIVGFLNRVLGIA